MGIIKFIALIFIAFIIFVLLGALTMVAWFLFLKFADFLERWFL